MPQLTERQRNKKNSGKMTNQEVHDFFKERVRDIVNKLKPYDKQGVIKAPNKDAYPYPEYYPGYNKNVSEYEAILVHSEKGIFPEKLIGERSPNQTPEEYSYVRRNYKQVTLPVFIDASNSIKRCWNDGNWDIDFPDENDLDEKYKKDNSLRNYIEQGIPVYNSIENYCRYLFPDLKLKDANGGVGVIPRGIHLAPDDYGNISYQETDDLREPIPIYYTCKQIVDPNDDEYFIVESTEKSACDYGESKKNIGRVYELYTKTQIWKAIQVGKYIDYNFVYVLVLEHNLGYVPFKRNMGVPVLIEGKLHYQSQFLYAVDNLDLCVLNASNLQLSINNCVYPIRVMIGNECEFKDAVTGNACQDGKIYDNEKHFTCPGCQGTGLKTRMSPMSTIFIRPKSRTDDAEIKAQDAIHFASPDTATLEFLVKKIADDETRARSLLHLKTSQQSQTGENVVESDSSKKANYAFIKPISDQIFGFFQWLVNTIGEYREGTAYKKITVTPPISFDFLTEQDYLTEINEAIKAQLPPFVIHTIVYKFLNTLYYTEAETAKRFHLIMAADRLLTLSENAISMGESKGTVEKWEVILHQSAINLIGDLEREDPTFWNLKLEDQINKLNERAQEKAKAIQSADPIEQFVVDKQKSFNSLASKEVEQEEEIEQETTIE